MTKQKNQLNELNELSELSELKKNIRYWLNNTDFVSFEAAIKEKVIGQKNLRIVLANVYNYLSNIAYDRPINNNMLLAAPSGCGKTETYRILKQYFREEIPGLIIYSFDTSQVTASGYRGVEPYEICAPFFKAGIYDAVGICFLDEFDKKLVPSFASSGTNINEDVQSNLLTIIEGAEITNRKNEAIDTSHIMFVGLGSFDHWRRKREPEQKIVGFLNDKENENIDHFSEISREDMVKTGGTHELIGRFPIIINYQKLSEDAIRCIIEKCKTDIEQTFDCTVKLDPAFETKLIENANSEFGCRLLDSLIRSAVINEYALALTEDAENKKLVIRVQDENVTTHSFRKYTKKELEAREKDIMCDMDSFFASDDFKVGQAPSQIQSLNDIFGF